MAICNLANIRRSFADRDLFSDISFYVNENEMVALVGANGTGKTTLLRIIAGLDDQYEGGLYVAPGAKIGYLRQDIQIDPEVTALDAATGVNEEVLECAHRLTNIYSQMETAGENERHRLGEELTDISHRFDSLNGFHYQVEAKQALLGLGLNREDLDKPVQALSGGQKVRVALARLLISDCDLLLLDEPTNHLDISSCEWLQDFLVNRFNASAIIVSHDRYFMDKTVSRTIEIENGSVSIFEGNYSTFHEKKAAQIEERKKLFKEQKKEIAKLEKSIQTLFSHRKFSRRDSKVKELERIERVENVSEKKTIKAQFGVAYKSGHEVIRIKGLKKSYAENTLFTGVDYVLERGRKVGVVGPNGSGKTTFLKVLAGAVDKDEGDVELGHNVDFVYFAQEFDHLDPEKTIVEELVRDSELSVKEARDLLAQFLFLGEDAFKTVSVLSGGEKCRLALAKVLANRPNLLFLDEPTNHLDIESREALEDALSGYAGTLMVASHDRYLLDAVTDEIVEIADGSFSRYHGNYSNYKEKTAQSARVDTGPKKKAAPVICENVQQQADFSSLREVEKAIRELDKKRKACEDEINHIEEEMPFIASELGNEENYKTGKSKELAEKYDGLNARLQEVYDTWDSVCTEIACLEEKKAGLA